MQLTAGVSGSGVRKLSTTPDSKPVPAAGPASQLPWTQGILL